MKKFNARLLAGLLSLLSSVIILNCSSKTEVKEVYLAGNRKMAIVLKSIQGINDPSQEAVYQAYFEDLLKKSINYTYQSQGIILSFSKNTLMESPENLFQIGIEEIDDLFLVDIHLPADFKIPDPNLTPVVEGEDAPPLPESPIEVSAVIHNGANLRTVNVFKLVINEFGKGSLESRFLNSFKKSSLDVYSNPNIYPKSDPAHFANLLYMYSKKQETDLAVALNCKDAPEVLKYYEKAEKLYEKASKRAAAKIVGQQSEAHQLSSRLTESTEKRKIIEICSEDEKLGFSFETDFGAIEPSSHANILEAYKKIGVEELLRKYTDKPVLFRFQIESNGDLSLFVHLRFSQTRYSAWTKDIPQRYRNYQILSLSPYYALMQKLVVLKSSLPSTAPAPLQTNFYNLRINLLLKTLLNGEVYFGVDGTFNPQAKVVSMKYPNSIYILIPGFETRMVSNKDPELFQEKGWIGLGSCKTIDGTFTEDGLVYRFFGFPCR